MRWDGMARDGARHYLRTPREHRVHANSTGRDAAGTARQNPLLRNLRDIRAGERGLEPAPDRQFPVNPT